MINVGIFLFDDVEVLDFAGPFEVFSVTSELNDYQLLKVFTVSRDGKQITAVNGLKVQPDYSFENHPDIDILVIPGGVGTRKGMEDPQVLEWINHNYSRSTVTFSVCSGARILGKLGLLDGMDSVTHHEVIAHLREIAPKTFIKAEQRFIDNGKIMTSGGISAGIDLSLYVVEKQFGKEVKNKTVRYMEYGSWRELVNE
jgi:transcriptional regulator GlxA family with amidase domain